MITTFGLSASIYVLLSIFYSATFFYLRTAGDLTQIILWLALCPPLIWLTVRDLRNFELPDIGTSLIALIAVIYIYLTDYPALFIHLTTGVLITAFIWLFGEVYFRWAGQEGLGIGDAKLFGAGAILIGPWQLPELFLLASLGGVLGYCVTRFHSNDAEQGIPFGPYIAYSIFILSFLEPLFL